MKALVLGSAGQVGSELVRSIPGAIGRTHAELSVTSADVEAAVADHSVDVVFNCAAYNAVDRAESEPDLAHQVNAFGAANVAAACARRGVRLVHFSTNFVFDGSLDRPYVESDLPRPLGAYASSKWEGERLVLAALPGALVIRSAAIFGDRGSAIKGGSFPHRILTQAQSGGRLRVVSDQRVNPTYARDLAQAAHQLAADEWRGIVHLVADGCCAWDEFARAALEACGVSAEVEPVTGSMLGLPARRPPNGCLASERVAPLRPWREAVLDWAARRMRG
jgi:dTDP-4-dehydrorhamnose reductase